MTRIPAVDAAFLAMETREHPCHVGMMLLFRLPEGAGEDYVGDMYRRLLTYDKLRQLYRLRPSVPGSVVGQMFWTEEDDSEIDLEHHVRLSALPRPGRVRELLDLVGRLHGSLLDRHRPLWEFHLIEGLDENRFAIYIKVHHALIDGLRAIEEFRAMFPADPEVRGVAPIWAVTDEPSEELLDEEADGPRPAPWKAVANKVVDIAGIAPTLAKAAGNAYSNEAAALPFTAPRTMLNVPITGARRFAAQSWSLARIKKVAKANGATVNDVVLAMSSGALRHYLIANDDLPDKSLIAGVPVGLPATAGSRQGGNSVTSVLCRLATDIEDPAERLAAIQASMLTVKETIAGRSALQVSAFGAIVGVLPSLISVVPGYAGNGPVPANIVISNVPGPREQLYFEGAPLVGLYPVSIPMDGLALNITVIGCNDHLDVGLIGCRRRVPHLQRLLDYLEESLAELEA